ncbi:MAG: alpha-ketoglutarate-dependent dioxygenase AlkB [Alphaproteobacteria bacterium]
MNLLLEIEEETMPDIPRLTYIPDFITGDEESSLIAAIDAQPWLNDLKRRVQHYGYKYDYKARAVTNDAYLGPLPDWIKPVAQKLSFNPDQAIVNEYQPGQGISAHVDCVPCFDNEIASLSLGSGATMQFIKGSEKQELYLKPRSLIILSGEARYEWTHAIPARKSDIADGFKIERGRRVSLTFRKVILNNLA